MPSTAFCPQKYANRQPHSKRRWREGIHPSGFSKQYFWGMGIFETFLGNRSLPGTLLFKFVVTQLLVSLAFIKFVVTWSGLYKWSWLSIWHVTPNSCYSFHTKLSRSGMSTGCAVLQVLSNDWPSPEFSIWALGGSASRNFQQRVIYEMIFLLAVLGFQMH